MLNLLPVLKFMVDFDITQCRLAREVIEWDSSPSPAAAIVKEVFEAEPVATRQVVWLLEPFRNPSVTHYTGTMDHLAGRGQLAQTLSTFVHYAFQWSEGNMIFADLQGMLISLSPQLILFRDLQALLDGSVPTQWGSSSLML